MMNFLKLIKHKWIIRFSIILYIAVLSLQLSCGKHEKVDKTPSIDKSNLTDAVSVKTSNEPANVSIAKRSRNGFSEAPTMVAVANVALKDVLSKIIVHNEPKYVKPVTKTVRRRISPEGNKVKIYLSFDDGPHSLPLGVDANYTEKIIQTLASNSVQDSIKAVFFVQTHVPNRGGSETGQTLLKMLEQEGHIIGIHTGSTADHVNHKTRASINAYDANDDGVVDEKDGVNALDSDIIRASSRISGLTGNTPQYVRPTYGSYNSATEAIYAKRGLSMIMWDIDSEDATNRYSAGEALAEVLRSRISKKIEQGETEILVLFHDIKPGTQSHLDDYLIAIYEGAQDVGKIAIFPTTTSELNDFLSRY